MKVFLYQECLDYEGAVKDLVFAAFDVAKQKAIQRRAEHDAAVAENIRLGHFKAADQEPWVEQETETSLLWSLGSETIAISEMQVCESLEEVQ